MSAIIDCLFVGFGGALGAIARYLLSLVPIKPESGFPVITLIINVIGAFCIGLIAALAGKLPDVDSRLLLFLKVGLCGGFTTFSTFSYETTILLQNGKHIPGISYILLSVFLCIAAVFCAQQFVK